MCLCGHADTHTHKQQIFQIVYHVALTICKADKCSLFSKLILSAARKDLHTENIFFIFLFVTVMWTPWYTGINFFPNYRTKEEERHSSTLAN